ncbi:protein CHROMATIN REMODELING 35 isoform X1 [Sesamum indicum]|uniref:Protein CHROMATIN REMODELING 35 isoform X1 n=1 Tax=Sesamum indicum TaxID=4182 RepID=A0A6I9U3R4_SESIN|nr:protein CHROMATIN REMODELING 35 isoform X1 [Sesamum indicum]
MAAATERNYYQNPILRRFPATSSSVDLGSKRRKRIKTDEGREYKDSAFSASWRFESDQRRNRTNSVVADHSDPFSLNNLLEELDSGKYGSVTKDIKELLMRRRQLLDSFYAVDPELPSACLDVQNKMAPKTTEPAASNVIDLDDDQDASSVAVQCFYPATQQLNNAGPVVIIDSDDEDAMGQNWRPPYLEVNLKKPSGNLLMKDFVDWNFVRNQSSREADAYVDDEAEPAHSGGVTETIKDKGEYVGPEDDMEDESGELSDTNSDGLGDIWNEMTVALECSKDATEDATLDEYDAGDEEECEHSFILKDDIGDVCRICGVIRRGIEKIIEYNFSKGTRSTRTYRYEGRTTRELDQTEIFPDGFKLSDGDFTAAEICPHPRHRKEMKPHQIEGFNFLLSNLVTDNPGGCIMAHAPGSGKTFMIISFLQSFMAKYPGARPLVVLPRGILAIWKKEFLRWQVEGIPLYDFYSVKADSRAQQLEVLKEWVKERSILFLGYKQFSSIICDTDDGQVAVACQNYLLKVPSILILDEGHTPRNQDTDVLTSLERVETARKVVLSGTLYQNHVKEVFNILNLVRPKFLKMETSKAIRRRILSRAEISSRRNLMKHGRENEFYELIEHTLIKDENHMRKVTVIQDLREMTRKVLHYYKGDNLDELPGLVDFAVFLRLSPWQKSEVKELTKSLARKFTISAQGSAIYVHPKLKALAKNSGVKDRVDEEKIDVVVEKLDVKEGAKLNFYLNLLQLCESSAEKLLVFSQYLLPLKFLERMTAKVKGYSVGREMFMITGDSDAETRESSMEKFNCSPEARVFFGSIRACGEGISLVGASRIIILDVHLNPSVTRQAIGRAFRPGQVKKVYTYRLIASGSPEEVDHITCFKKESIAKMWFEWDQCSGHQNPEMETVDVNNCGDIFLETARLNEDVISVFKR